MTLGLLDACAIAFPLLLCGGVCGFLVQRYLDSRHRVQHSEQFDFLIPDPDVELPRKIARYGDMGEGLKLELFKEDDGDVIVSIMPQGHVIPRAGNSLQFCTPMAGGGKSHRTHRALLELMQAMAADEADRPHLQEDEKR